ncbi:MAG: hypothetical protein RJB11_2891 [Planctomycetota bacterium]
MDSSGILMATSICFWAGCWVLVLSETVLVLERRLASANTSLTTNNCAIPLSYPIHSTAQHHRWSRSDIVFFPTAYEH